VFNNFPINSSGSTNKNLLLFIVRFYAYSISMPKGHGIALAPLKGAKLSFIEGKLES